MAGYPAATPSEPTANGPTSPVSEHKQPRRQSIQSNQSSRMSSITYKHDQLPQSVIALLQHGKFVHLGTADTTGVPDVALMNYYYLASKELYSPETSEEGPEVNADSKEHTYIILATKESSSKYKNIAQNPHVSLLFHDWTTAKNMYKKSDSSNDSSNIFKMLQNLNQTELSQVSATLSGKAKIVSNADELSYYKTKLLKENPDAEIYIDGEENSIILVKITSAKVCDTQNHHKYYQ